MTCWTITSYCNNVSMPLMLRGLRRRKKICHESGRILLVQSTNHTILAYESHAYIQRTPTTAH